MRFIYNWNELIVQNFNERQFHLDSVLIFITGGHQCNFHLLPFMFTHRESNLIVELKLICFIRTEKCTMSFQHGQSDKCTLQIVVHQSEICETKYILMYDVHTLQNVLYFIKYICQLFAKYVNMQNIQKYTWMNIS